MQQIEQWLEQYYMPYAMPIIGVVLAVLILLLVLFCYLARKNRRTGKLFAGILAVWVVAIAVIAAWVYLEANQEVLFLGVG